MASEEMYTASAGYRDLPAPEARAETAPLAPPEHNLAAAVGAGLAAALLAALLWAGLTVATGYHFVFALLAVGVFVGLAVRVAGNGSEPVFGAVGALLAVFGCAVGTVFADCAYLANVARLPLSDVVGQLTPGLAWQILLASASPLEMILLGAAAYGGYRLSAV